MKFARGLALKENTPQIPGKSTANVTPGTARSSSKPLLLLFIVFFGLVAFVFFLQSRQGAIDWISDYKTGIELAKKQNKPVLLAFYKQGAPMCTSMFNDTYSNPTVVKYIKAHFVPILIDVDAQPEIAKRYDVGYYPTHYVQLPDSDERFGPRLGYDPPARFIAELAKLLKRAGLESE